MDCTRFWLIRHAAVSEADRAALYGRNDVPICSDSLAQDAPTYLRLALRLPPNATWFVSPLSRTRQTAAAIRRAGCKAAEPTIEPGLTEQDLGTWQGLRHAELPARLIDPAHPFWPLGANEIPPGGESMAEVLTRVGDTIERLATAHAGADLICISHGGAIRAAVAHALGMDARGALHLSVQNLSLTVIERFSIGWRVVTVNEGAEFAPPRRDHAAADEVVCENASIRP